MKSRGYLFTVCLSIHLSIYSPCQPACHLHTHLLPYPLIIYPSVYSPTYPCIAIQLPNHLAASPLTHPSIHPSIYKSPLTSLWIPLYLLVEVTSCGGLNKNNLHKCIHLNVWFSIGETIWEGLRGIALSEEACYWGKGGRALKFQKTTAFTVSMPPTFLRQDCGSDVNP